MAILTLDRSLVTNLRIGGELLDHNCYRQKIFRLVQMKVSFYYLGMNGTF